MSLLPPGFNFWAHPKTIGVVDDEAYEALKNGTLDPESMRQVKINIDNARMALELTPSLNELPI